MVIKFITAMITRPTAVKRIAQPAPFCSAVGTNWTLVLSILESSGCKSASYIGSTKPSSSSPPFSSFSSPSFSSPSSPSSSPFSYFFAPPFFSASPSFSLPLSSPSSLLASTNYNLCIFFILLDDLVEARTLYFKRRGFTPVGFVEWTTDQSCVWTLDFKRRGLIPELVEWTGWDQSRDFNLEHSIL